jgi:hypothetical protein
MRRGWLALVLLAGCLSGQGDLLPDSPGGADCAHPGASSFGRNPTTGMCVEFESSCDVPAEWKACTPVECAGDAECSATQRCEELPDDGDAATPARACVDNGGCVGQEDCPAATICDATQPFGDDPSKGTCVQAPAPPSMGECQATSECGQGEICPAQYGGCSEGGEPPGGGGGGGGGGADGGVTLPCTSECEPACVVDADCGDVVTSGLRCNAAEVCGQGNGVACAGWCVPG